MNKLKLGPLEDDKPVKIALELPAAVYRDLVAYGELLAKEAGVPPTEPVKLISPMIARFMATDRAFRRQRRASGNRHTPQRPDTRQAS